MLFRFFQFVLWLLCFCHFVFAANGDITGMYNIQSALTDAGVEVHVVEMPHAPTVDIRVYLRGGSAAEAALRGAGVAHAVQRTISASIAEEVYNDTNGLYSGTFNGETYYDAICFHANVPRGNSRNALRLLAESISSENFSAKSWRSLRDTLSYEILQEQEQPAHQLHTLFLRARYPLTPARYPVYGTHALFLKVRRRDLNEYYSRTFTAGNCVVVIAGDVDADALIRFVNTTFTALPQDSFSLVPAFPEESTLQPVHITHYANTDRSYICVALTTVREGAADYSAAKLLSHIIEIQKNDLQNTLLAVAPNASLITLHHDIVPTHHGVLKILFDVDPVNKEKAVDSVVNWVLKLRAKRWRQKDIDAAKAAMSTHLRHNLSIPSYVGNDVGLSVMRLNTPYAPFTRLHDWNSITKNSIEALCRRICADSRITTVSISPWVDEIPGHSDNTPLMVSERRLIDTENYPVSRRVLRNGATLLMRYTPQAPAIQVQCAAIGGLWCESSDASGLFSVLGATMTYATQRHGPDDFTELCQRYGVLMHTETLPETIRLTATTSPKFAYDAVQLVCEAWVTPLMSEAACQKALQEISGRLDGIATNSAQLASTVMRSLLYPRLPYGNNMYGSLRSLMNVYPDNIQKTHNDFITPKNTTVLISGDFDTMRMANTVRDAFSRFEETEKSKEFVMRTPAITLHTQAPYMQPKLPPPVPITNDVTQVYAGMRKDGMVMWGMRLPPLITTGMPAYVGYIITAALQQELAVMQYKWQDFRGVPLITHARATHWQGYGAGWVYVYCSVRSEGMSEASQRIKTAVRNALQNIRTENGLAVAKKHARAYLALEATTPEEMLSRIITRNIFGYTFRVPGAVSRYIDEADVKSIQSLLDTYESTENMSLILPRQ